MMLSRTMTEYDETKIKDCKEDMDTLLVFVSYTETFPLPFSFSLDCQGRSLLRRADSVQY